MGFFRRPASQPRNAERVLHSVPTASVPSALLLQGNENLKVVGESFHQDSLWSLVGGRGDPARYVRVPIIAMLSAEPDNPYDRNAVAVSIDGLKVGHLSRQDAQLYQPGLLALQRRYKRPIALAGVIVGGGYRQDGPGLLGVFLNYDPGDFGVQRLMPARPARSGMRTGLSEELAYSNSGWSDELARLSGLPKIDVGALPALRQLLSHETDPIKRHFIYSQLEARLYRCRDVFASALDEFDQTCREHDAEMDGVREAFLKEWGCVPLLELYRQMAIRMQKAHDYRQALWWAERGIALYGSEPATSEGIDDLRHRAADYMSKLPERCALSSGCRTVALSTPRMQASSAE